MTEKKTIYHIVKYPTSYLTLRFSLAKPSLHSRFDMG